MLQQQMDAQRAANKNKPTGYDSVEVTHYGAAPKAGDAARQRQAKIQQAGKQGPTGIGQLAQQAYGGGPSTMMGAPTLGGGTIAGARTFQGVGRDDLTGFNAATVGAPTMFPGSVPGLQGNPTGPSFGPGEGPINQANENLPGTFDTTVSNPGAGEFEAGAPEGQDYIGGLYDAMLGQTEQAGKDYLDMGNSYLGLLMRQQNEQAALSGQSSLGGSWHGGQRQAAIGAMDQNRIFQQQLLDKNLGIRGDFANKMYDVNNIESERAWQDIQNKMASASEAVQNAFANPSAIVKDLAGNVMSIAEIMALYPGTDVATATALQNAARMWYVDKKAYQGMMADSSETMQTMAENV
jgi:hypothetical protein